MSTVIVTYMFTVEVEDPADHDAVVEAVEQYVASVRDPFAGPVAIEVEAIGTS